MRNPNRSRRPLIETLKQLSALLPRRDDIAAEARLYYRRACLAAAEERYDVALIFCDKALALDSQDLAARLLVAQIRHRGMKDVDGAVAAYQKVISLTGYDGENPFCAAARAGLDELITEVSGPGVATPEEPPREVKGA